MGLNILYKNTLSQHVLLAIQALLRNVVNQCLEKAYIAGLKFKRRNDGNGIWGSSQWKDKPVKLLRVPDSSPFGLKGLRVSIKSIHSGLLTWPERPAMQGFFEKHHTQSFEF